MNFQLKPRPHIRNNTGKEQSGNTEMLNVVTIALLFVAAWAIGSRYVLFGPAVAIHIVLMIVTAVVAGLFAHTIFYLFMDGLEKVKFASFGERLKSTWPRTMAGAPFVTALIIALGTQPRIPLYVVAVAVIITEIFVKLVFGGFGQNLFNPAAFAFLFIALSFGNTTIETWYLPDTITSATPLAGLNRMNWLMTAEEAYHFVRTSGGFGRMLMGNVPGAVAETSRLAILIAFVYMAWKKALDWVLPVFYVGTVFLITLIYGLIIGAGILYPLIHILTGGIIFGAVFMATDPVTTPINRQGKAIWAILLGMFTLLIRFTANHAEGVAFSLLLMNILVPIIDSRTANITIADTSKKIMSIVIAFVASAVIVIGLTMLINAFA